MNCIVVAIISLPVANSDILLALMSSLSRPREQRLSVITARKRRRVVE